MLIDFSFKNVRSFKDEVTFSMEVGEGITDYAVENTISSGEIDVVKSSFIFGGNASGKTNVIRAFQLLRQIVVDGTPSNLVTLPIDTFADESGDTNFKIHFTKNGNLYYYELNYDWDAIINECLTMNGVVIFKRTADEISMPPLIKDLKIQSLCQEAHCMTLRMVKSLRRNRLLSRMLSSRLSSISVH